MLKTTSIKSVKYLLVLVNVVKEDVVNNTEYKTIKKK